MYPAARELIGAGWPNEAEPLQLFLELLLQRRSNVEVARVMLLFE